MTRSGIALADYVTKVDQRIAVVRCLAQRAGAAGRTEDRLTPGDSGAGQATASDKGCVKCHGVAGTNDHPMIPNLAGLPAFYLQVQLLRFRASTADPDQANGLIASRHDRVMSPPARDLTDVEIRDLSAYFSDLACGSDGSHRGSVSKVFMRCTECHGAGGMSEDTLIPHLAGQKEGYLARQLKLFRLTGKDVSRVDEEETRYHHAMAQHWAVLDDKTIDRLAGYLAALPC